MSYLEQAGGSLYYEVIDLTAPWVENPQTVIFHHGIGITSRIWSEWVPALVDRFRVVRFDTRGFGRSSVPGAGFEWSLKLLAEDVLAVARAAEAETFHLIGESLGGTVPLYMGVHHPEPLRSITVCNAAHRGGSIKRVEEWRDFISKNGMEAWSTMMMPLRFDPETTRQGVYAWYEREQAASSADSVLDLAELLIGTDLTPSLASISVPTLLISPDGSPFVSTEITREIHDRIPDAEMQIFAGTRHGLVCSHGKECSQCFLEFLIRRGLG